MIRVQSPPKEPQCCCCHIKIGMHVFGVYWIISSLLWASYLIWCMVVIEDVVKAQDNNVNQYEVNDDVVSEGTHMEVVLGLYLAFIVACIVSAGLLMYGVTQNKSGYMLMCLILQGVDLSFWGIWLIACFFVWTTVALNMGVGLGVGWVLGICIAAVGFKAFLMYMSVRCYNHIKRPPQYDGVVIETPYNGPQIQNGRGVVLGTFPEQPYNGDCEMLVPRSYY